MSAVFILKNNDNWQVNMNVLQAKCLPQLITKQECICLEATTSTCKNLMMFINAWTGGASALDQASKSYARFTAQQREDLKEVFLLLQLEFLLEYINDLNRKFKFQ